MGLDIRPCVRRGFVERVEEVCVRTRLSWIVLGPVAARTMQLKILKKRFLVFLSRSFFRILDFYWYDFLELAEQTVMPEGLIPLFRLAELHDPEGSLNLATLAWNHRS